MEAVATGNVIAVNLFWPTFMFEADLWLLRFQVLNGDIFDLKQQRSAVSETAFDYILDHLLLPVDRDPLVHQRFKSDAVQLAIYSNIEPPMQHRRVLHTFTYSYIGDQIGGPMLD